MTTVSHRLTIPDLIAFFHVMRRAATATVTAGTTFVASEDAMKNVEEKKKRMGNFHKLKCS